MKGFIRADEDNSENKETHTVTSPTLNGKKNFYEVLYQCKHVNIVSMSSVPSIIVL
jgi:hypothetical protein